MSYLGTAHQPASHCAEPLRAAAGAGDPNAVGFATPLDPVSPQALVGQRVINEPSSVVWPQVKSHQPAAREGVVPRCRLELFRPTRRDPFAAKKAITLNAERDGVVIRQTYHLSSRLLNRLDKKCSRAHAQCIRELLQNLKRRRRVAV